ncbi:MAG: CapA family protein [Lachnospiraceae bacterium]|nr:CapA family protein [Lachnospiraceae bacterium]
MNENISESTISSETDSSDIQVPDSETETTTEPLTSPPEPYSPVTIAMTGDILLSDRLYQRYCEGGITGFISPLIADTLANADITFINQEFPFSNRGTPEPGKEYTYCVPTSYAHIFPEMGVDIVSLSNNHTLDYGQDALLDTFTVLDEIGIDYIGAGPDLNRARQLITKEVRGKTIGFLAASRVVPSGEWYARNAGEGYDARAGVFTTYDSAALCQEIRTAKEKCDVVIVYAHWGIERQEVAADYQRILAKDYIDAGADLVVGSHAHVMQGVEYYKDIPIVYGLGNFLFSNYYSRTTVLTVTIDETNKCSISFLPCKSQTYYTSECDAAGQKEFFSFLNRVSFDVTFD